MIRPVFEALASEGPKRHFTVGIYDDVTNLSLPIDTEFRSPRPKGEVQAVFFGMGSDGTVGANKASVKIIGEGTDLFAQGYFVYDSKKSGGITVSHLRFGPRPIESAYLIDAADFVACHQFGLLEKTKVLEYAKPGATFLLNSPYGPDEVWDHLPRAGPAAAHRQVDRPLGHRRLRGRHRGRHGQPHQHGHAALLLPPRRGAARPTRRSPGSRASSRRPTPSAGRPSWTATSRRSTCPSRAWATSTLGPAATGQPIPALIPDDAPDFVRTVTAALMAGEGDLLPVSAFPVDGTFPAGTTRYEKRAIAHEIPIWDPSICIDCGKCAMVCPHAAIRMKVFPEAAVEGAPAGYQSKEFKSRDLADHRLTIQVAPDDCTGCGVCVDVCPAKSKTEVRHKAINMQPAMEHREAERPNWDFFQSIPPLDRTLLAHDTVKGAQALEPLFEFSLACSGCGETPYLKLVSQLFGDRMIVANATGCSSIYGANLPTTPWTVNAEGRGPAWNNSLFEDNAEFGLGMRLALDAQSEHARQLLEVLAPEVGEGLVHELLESGQETEAEIAAQRGRVERLRDALASVEGDRAPEAKRLLALAGDLVRRGIWIIGGDGWAYDIGFGGLDQVLSSGRNVNILVLDTEVYSNTGGQASKATPRGAVAKFAAAGKSSGKKDLGAIARSYGDVYVAQVAMGANDAQVTRALLEADAWPGPSLVIAYSTCIAHGIDMSTSMSHQKDAVKSGYWPLYRFRPSEVEDDQPFKLDSGAPTIPIRDFARLRDEVRDPGADRPGPGRRAGRPGPGRRRRALALLRAARRDRPQRSPRPSSRPGCRRKRRPERGRERGRDGGSGVSVDLHTRYLGLDLRSPIVASSSPFTGREETARLIEEAGRRGDRPAVALRGGDPQRGDPAEPLPRGRHGPVRRGARLLPRRRVVRRPGGPLPGPPGADQGLVVGPGDRQPQRHHDRRVGPLCPADAGRRGRRP